MMNGTPKIYASREYPWGDLIAIRFGVEFEGRVHVATPVQMSEHKPGESVEPMLSLPTQTAQMLMDQLWECGLRPTEGTGSAGAFEAQRRHLEDMRTLVFTPKP